MWKWITILVVIIAIITCIVAYLDRRDRRRK
jgi:hypothetical protein